MSKDDILKNLPKGFSEWKPENYLNNEEDIRFYLEAAQREGNNDPALMAVIFEDIHKARELNAKRRTKGEKVKPTLENLKKLAGDFGYRLTFEPIQEHPHQSAE